MARASTAPSACTLRSTRDEERAVERLPVDDLELRAGHDPALAEEAEHLGIGVGDPDEGRRLARLELVERRRRRLGELQLAARDRVAVRVDRRVAELRRDQLLELLRERMLEHLGLGVHLVPGHAEALDEEQLDSRWWRITSSATRRPRLVRRTPR